MAAPTSNLRLGVMLLAIGLSSVLWSVAHCSSSIERGYDIPTELIGLKDDLVMTDQSVDAVNVRVKGSRAALRNLSPSDLYFRLDVSGAKAGVAEYDVDQSRIELPRGLRIVSRSPSRIQLRFERRGRKAVSVHADIEGEPAAGYLLRGVEVEPRRVWLAGARSQVLRLKQVPTEPVDISGLKESEEREVRIFLGTGSVWLEENEPVAVRLLIEPDPEAQAARELEEAPTPAVPRETG